MSIVAPTESLRFQFRQALADSVKPFSLSPASFGWPGNNDELFTSIRKFYMLLPINGLRKDWPQWHKQDRRKIIRQHLEAVCDIASVTSYNVETVDVWLTNIQAPRESLVLIGRHVEERYGSICFICGRRIIEYKTVDHVLPMSRGGSDDVVNYRLAHSSCNAAKNNSIIGDHVGWTGARLDISVDEVPVRLRYLVFLREDFTCGNRDCNHGLHTGHQIRTSLRHKTGILCYDNLRVECEICQPFDEDKT